MDKISKEERIFLISLGERIHSRRKELGITQEELADKIGINKHHFRRIEKGQSPTSLITYRRISKKLKISLVDIIKDI
jgi:transcriptional regulator with XRE-family HTH domain